MKNVKTKNLTPWCSLYSTESKFDIEVKPLNYRYVAILSVIWLLTIYLALLNFHYLLVLAFGCLSLYAVSAFSLNNEEQGRALLPTLFFSLSPQGICTFKNNNFLGQQLNQANQTLPSAFILNKKLAADTWRISPQSRVSFLGCWLYLQKENKASLIALSEEPIKAVNREYTRVKRADKHALFIPKQCLSEQSFSRLARIIKRVKDDQVGC